MGGRCHPGCSRLCVGHCTLLKSWSCLACVEVGGTGNSTEQILMIKILLMASQLSTLPRAHPAGLQSRQRHTWASECDCTLDAAKATQYQIECDIA